MAEDAPYSMHCIQILEGFEAVRKRPGMYIGDTDRRGVVHLFQEVLSNAIDLTLAGRSGSTIDVSVSADGSVFTVTDKGPGIFVRLADDQCDRDDGLAYFTKLHHRPTADGHAPHVHIGRCGVGLFVLGALTEQLQVRTWHQGRCVGFEMRKGVVVHAPWRVQRDALEAWANTEGTTMRWTPDRTIFKTMDGSIVDDVRAMVSDIVQLIPGVCIAMGAEVFGPVSSLMPLALSQFQALEPTGRLANPRFVASGLTDEVHWRLALAGQATHQPGTLRGWCNGGANDGGSHVEALADALAQVGLSPQMGVVHLLAHNPQYAGPTRGILDRPQWVAGLTDAFVASLRDAMA